MVLNLDSILYCRYHKINIQRFCTGLANTFLLCLLLSQLLTCMISDQSIALDRHAQLICQRAKKIPTGWLSDLYCRAKSTCFLLQSKIKRICDMFSQLLPQQLYHPCVHLPTYLTLMKSRRMRRESHQKFPYKMMSFRSSA